LNNETRDVRRLKAAEIKEGYEMQSRIQFIRPYKKIKDC
jgi:hypothetical protein